MIESIINGYQNSEDSNFRPKKGRSIGQVAGESIGETTYLYFQPLTWAYKKIKSIVKRQ